MKKDDFIDDEIDLEPFKKELKDIEIIEDKNKSIINNSSKNEIAENYSNELLKKYNVDANAFIQYEDIHNRRVTANKMIFAIIIAVIIIFSCLIMGIVFGLQNYINKNRDIYIPANTNNNGSIVKTITGPFYQFDTNVSNAPAKALYCDLGVANVAALGELTNYEYFRGNFEVRLRINNDKGENVNTVGLVTIPKVLTSNINLYNQGINGLPKENDLKLNISNKINSWNGKTILNSVYLGIAIYNANPLSPALTLGKNIHNLKNNRKHNYLIIYVYENNPNNTSVRSIHSNNSTFIFWTSGS